MTLRALGRSHVFAAGFSLTLHACLLGLASGYWVTDRSFNQKAPKEQIVLLNLLPAKEQESIKPDVPSGKPEPLPVRNQVISQTAVAPVVTKETPKQPASMTAPPPPSAEEWAFAAKYTNKNSKGYRYSWGQQVRSMMGTAIEGPDQGVVRFRVEIAPDGTLTKLETLWSTSVVAEQLARKAIQTMPSLPATPTGKLLIFEKTISFTPYANDGPPIYRDDCVPDPPVFRNPFAWDGKSPQMPTAPPKTEKLDPQAMEECLRQLPKDSIEAEAAQDQRAMDRWGWRK
jgi:hypothetical protein